SKLDLAQTMANLQKAGLLDPGAMRQFQKSGQTRGAELAERMKRDGGKAAPAEMMKQLARDGRGGAQDGGGPHPLNFGQGAKEHKGKFKEAILAPADLEKALKKSRAGQVRATKPPPDAGKEPPGSGSLSGANAGGGAANTQTVLPRHRGAVDRYFERK